MSMKKLFTTISTAFLVLLLNTFGLALHASAMPMASHEMNGMNHTSGNSANCATLCRTAVFNKEEVLNTATEENDDEPQLPFYAQFQTGLFSRIDPKSRLYAANVKPPPKVPIYILYGVSRS